MSTATSEPRFLTTGAAARMAVCSAETIRAWHRRGVLQAERTEGGIRLFDVADVRRLAESRTARRLTLDATQRTTLDT